MDKFRTLRDLCNSLFGNLIGTGNLVGTDFANVKVERVEQVFPQDSRGYRIQFTVSSHAVGKLDAETQDALYALLDEKEPHP